MATIQCKMCGGLLDLPENVTAAECPYCGTLTTFPKLENAQIEQLYNRAEQFRQKSDFDRAEQVYEQLIQLSPEDPEVYWGLVLSRFGIEYVEDPVSRERIPTCHRVQFDSIFSDPDYLQTIRLAAGLDRDIYQKEAQRIGDIQQEILTISAQEKPYDVFICYKETTEGGTRTKDSADAQDIYYQLTNIGYKVFFSRITLEGKLGQQYEPYIFAALNSAKVMLVIGSCKEFFEAVWVRNEWSRFLALIKKDRSKLIIPCYKGMSAYDLPAELSRFQAQDMSRIGFMQDLIHGIKKVVNNEALKEKAEITDKENLESPRSSVTNLLRRVQLFLETGDFKSATEYCNKVLDLDAENAHAYWYRLMAEDQVSDDSALDLTGNLMESPSFKLAQKFAKEQPLINAIQNFVTRCSECAAAIRSTVEQGNQYFAEEQYTEAVILYRKAADLGDAEAQYKLGLCYENGHGVAIDVKKATSLYRQAASQGYIGAVNAVKRFKPPTWREHLFSENGRTPRKWYLCLVLSDIALVGILAVFIGNGLDVIGCIFWFLCTIPLMIANYTMFLRRLHDIGKSDWYLWYLLILSIIPGAIILIIVYLLCAPSQEGKNKYGPCPSDTFE